MKSYPCRLCAGFARLLALGCLNAALAQEQPLTLFDSAREGSTNRVKATDAQVKVEGARGLRVATGTSQPWPGIVVTAPSNHWDLARYRYVRCDLENLGNEPLTVSCRVDNAGADGKRNCITGSLRLGPRGHGMLTVSLNATPWRLTEPLNLVGMRAAPGNPESFDPARVVQLLLFVTQSKTNRAFLLGPLEAGGTVTTLEARSFFPFIDEFGQFKHADWPGKTHTPADFARQRKAEAQDVEAHPGPPDRNRYGGWTQGPTLPATGQFRVEKHAGKWWLVDPDGRLFWSHGIDCVGMGNATPITDREHYFEVLPKPDSPLAPFYGQAQWAPHGYYQTHSPYRTYDFGRANLRRKFGQTWAETTADLTHHRLRSWGLNTIANWSDARLYLERRTPYTANLSANARLLEGSEGYWGKFYDVFDPTFRDNLRRRLVAEQNTTAKDPWCIGYFVHNELGWGDDTSLAVATVKSPASQPAKQVLRERLQSRYGDVARLNAAWGAQHADWDAFLQSQQAPDARRARPDLEAFYTEFAETYFRVIREEIKRVAPARLYLGCRFAWVNDRAARAAAKYCDVISYNRYEYSVAQQRPPEGSDLPLIIGEFHFGALDRGMFHTGLRQTASQADRADKYRDYVRGALRNPFLVGTHWFQYQDQATTGRGDGENYQIGFVDVCDTPYPEIVAASRELGQALYPLRSAPTE